MGKLAGGSESECANLAINKFSNKVCVAWRVENHSVLVVVHSHGSRSCSGMCNSLSSKLGSREDEAKYFYSISIMSDVHKGKKCK